MRRAKVVSLTWIACLLAAVSLGDEAIANWPAPPVWSPRGLSRGVSTMNIPTDPLPFIGVAPCRVADTRGNGFTGQYGPPALVADATRSFTIAGQCGIPDFAQAVSFNFTAVNVTGAGDLRVFPAGGAVPLVSTLNYNAATPNIANAAIVPLNFSGAITVQADAVSIGLIIDVNGYYAAARTSSLNTFLGPGAGSSNTTGLSNVGIGPGALQGNQEGNYNTAVGISALSQSTEGNNTAIGSFAFQALSTGLGNIALGNCAGCIFSSGSRNIYIASEGVSSESDTIRIGYFFQASARAFIDGIRGRTTGMADAVAVVIDSNGQLGTVSSSIRGKEAVEEMGDSSSGLLKLRPVSFRYKGQEGRRKQFGLIAEEVEEILPDLVVHDASGNVETVLYHEMPAMLLNEIQKQQRRIEEQRREIESLRDRLAALEERLGRQ